MSKKSIKINKGKGIKSLREDLVFAERTEKAWKRYEKGGFKTMDYKEFLKMLKKL